RTLRIERVESLDINPAALYVTGDDLLIGSVQDSSLVDMDMATGTRVGLVRIQQFSGIVAASNGWVVATTYGSTPRLLFLDAATLAVVRATRLPSQVTAMAAAEDSVLCSLPAQGMLVSVPTA